MAYRLLVITSGRVCKGHSRVPDKTAYVHLVVEWRGDVVHEVADIALDGHRALAERDLVEVTQKLLERLDEGPLGHNADTVRKQHPPVCDQGGSGGALGIGVADRVFILQHA